MIDQSSNDRHAKGVLIRQSPCGVKETIDLLEGFLNNKGITIYARINQQKEAHGAGLDLLPLEYLLFGNPKTGGTIMEKFPLIALDLPLKAIAWQDINHQVWLAYNDTAYMEERYLLPPAALSSLSLDVVIGKALENKVH
jgi:uncharacterized protein (DUF302 family)